MSNNCAVVAGFHQLQLPSALVGYKEAYFFCTETPLGRKVLCTLGWNVAPLNLTMTERAPNIFRDQQQLRKLHGSTQLDVQYRLLIPQKGLLHDSLLYVTPSLLETSSWTHYCHYCWTQSQLTGVASWITFWHLNMSCVYTKKKKISFASIHWHLTGLYMFKSILWRDGRFGQSH